jgi:hypothetical protein
VTQQRSGDQLIQSQLPLAPRQGNPFLQDILRQSPTGIKWLAIHHHLLAPQQSIKACQRSHGMHDIAGLNTTHHRKPGLNMVRKLPGIGQGQLSGTIA